MGPAAEHPGVMKAVLLRPKALQSWVDATFGPESDQAVAFGYAKKQKTKVTATERAPAAAKAKQTRRALGTKWPKQKKAAKEQLVQPAEAPAEPAATPGTPATETPKP